MPKLKIKSSNKDEDNQWQIECDCRTLSEAMEIRRDPKRLKAAVDYAKEKTKNLNSIINEAAEEQMED
jgi:hypothetical protein